MKEINASEINVNPMKPKNVLNKKFWIHGKLNSKVRLRLMDIADDFIKFLNIKWVHPIDIVFTGSMANFNWTKFSDVDIHIIINYRDVYDNTEFVDEYFEMKKRIWSDEHDNLKIYGFPVELYVEDSNEVSFSSGVYSIEKNEWIKTPSKFNENKLNEKFIKKKSAEIINKIDLISSSIENTKDEYKLREFSKKAKLLFKKIKNKRKECLEIEGEVGNWNIIYKLLRANGYLEKLWNISTNIYDKINSIY